MSAKTMPVLVVMTMTMVLGLLSKNPYLRPDINRALIRVSTALAVMAEALKVLAFRKVQGSTGTRF